jgi:protein SCO1/2
MIAFLLALSLSSANPSLYDALTSTWTTQKGEHVKLASLAGKPVVIAMIYAHCRAMCPLTIADMKSIERKLGKGEARFVLVSFDPARDTPELLKQLALDDKLDDWTLLGGSDGDVRELAAVLGVKYRKAGDEFVHSAIITVLDERGAIIAQQVGTQRDDAALVEQVAKLAR